MIAEDEDVRVLRQDMGVCHMVCLGHGLPVHAEQYTTLGSHAILIVCS